MLAAALVAYLAPAGASAAAGCGADSPFVVSSFTSTGSQCLAFPGLASLPRGPFAIADSFPMPYFVTAPCHDVSPQQTNCTSFNGGDKVDTPAFAVSNTQCYALGHNANMSLSLLSPGDPTGGVAVAFGGGVGGRKVTFHFVCDESAAASAGPTQAIEGGMQGYVFLWPTQNVCKPQPVAAARCPAQAAIPKPSTELLLYQEMEMGALICYNMGESTAACEHVFSLRCAACSHADRCCVPQPPPPRPRAARPSKCPPPAFSTTASRRTSTPTSGARRSPPSAANVKQ